MSNLLKRRKRLSDLEVRYYLIQLISALQYLHQNLVIHRDLKLGNLFIDSEMRIKVGDFGLATRLADASERKKTFCGTPNYIGKENGYLFIFYINHFLLFVCQFYLFL
jgi:serine/threonine protein kinase